MRINLYVSIYGSFCFNNIAYPFRFCPKAQGPLPYGILGKLDLPPSGFSALTLKIVIAWKLKFKNCHLDDQLQHWFKWGFNCHGLDISFFSFLHDLEEKIFDKLMVLTLWLKLTTTACSGFKTLEEGRAKII